MNPVNDENIIADLQACNAAGLAQLERSHKPESLKFIFTHLKDWSSGKERKCTPAEADELWQEALIRVYEMFCIRKAVLTCRLNTLVNTILRNVWSVEFRKKTKTVESLPEAAAADLPDLGPLRSWVRARLEKTAEPCRTMLILRYYYQLDYDGVATLMGYNSGDVVRNLIARCRKTFREQFPVDWDQIDNQMPSDNPDSPPKPAQIDPSRLPDI
ncbi:MAG: sigma-70 family RNA polymerase sigma factor [Saprospiraceae bacterium]|nr:sigma-70 family RNA polymerase sigma factor [Saprospiraceae bacterium]